MSLTLTVDSDQLKQPESKLALFIGFTLLALQGVGGVLAVAQQELVERRRWMSKSQFIEEWSIAQIMPGPNIVNLALMFGRRHFGLPGALAAVAGLLIAPLTVVLLLAILFGGVSDNPMAQGALKGMGAVSAGLIIATGFKLGSTLNENPVGLRLAWLISFAAFVGVGLLRLPLAWVLFGLGILACWVAHRALSVIASQNPSNADTDKAES